MMATRFRRRLTTAAALSLSSSAIVVLGALLAVPGIALAFLRAGSSRPAARDTPLPARDTPLLLTQKEEQDA
jgi:hypothetical protein